MLRSRLALAASAAVAVVSILTAPLSVEARRCGEEPPKTLLALYRESAEIHIAKLDRQIETGIIEEGESYRVMGIQRQFSISTTLKGETRKFIAIDDQEYRYTGQEAEPVEEGPDEHVVGTKVGDTVMLFVKPSEEDNTKLVLSHYRDAEKKLEAEQMSAYEKMVGSLNSLHTNGTPTDDAVIGWLMSVARDPLTRWEGVAELLTSVEYGEYRQERLSYLKEQKAKPEGLEEWEAEELKELTEDSREYGSARLATRLTAAQKEELLTLALEVEPKPAEGDAKYPEMSEGDRMLMELVSRWGDSRLVAKMADSLRGNIEPYQASLMMEKIVRIIDDADARKIAERYSGVFYMDTDEAITAERAGEMELTAEESGIFPNAENKNPAAVKTFGQLRDELIGRFVSRVDAVLTTAAK